IPVLATTATANERVTLDVAEQLSSGGTTPRTPRGAPDSENRNRIGRAASPGADGDVLVLRGSLDRESLRLAVVSLPAAPMRLAWLAANLASGALPGSGIIYTLTVAAAYETAAFLRDQGISVTAYSGK